MRKQRSTPLQLFLMGHNGGASELEEPQCAGSASRVTKKTRDKFSFRSFNWC